MKDPSELENKGLKPAANKAEEKTVRIKLRPGRSVAGVTVDADGCAVVDAKLAAYLVSIGYATEEA